LRSDNNAWLKNITDKLRRKPIKNLPNEEITVEFISEEKSSYKEENVNQAPLLT
jgi:hypothetical protein